ncbi:MAG TPA: FAD-binding oxidoreductase, partial [Clostridiales bacterium]|nr:FAD-binding oxidoreductase [Clostridiales bacterium]
MSTIIWKSTGVANELGEEKGKSLWTQKEYKDIEESYYKRALPAKENISTDVLIIGAGMAGVLIAQALVERGKTVVVIDKNKTGGVITRNTTAKVSSQHDLIFDKLLKTKGEARAREYAMSNQRAITKYKELIKKHNINCDFEVLPSYIYTLTDEAKIKKEVEAAKRLGIPASFTR